MFPPFLSVQYQPLIMDYAGSAYYFFNSSFSGVLSFPHCSAEQSSEAFGLSQHLNSDGRDSIQLFLVRRETTQLERT